MITSVIVLFVVALALGGYLAFDILHGRKNISVASNESASAVPQTAEKAVEKEPATEKAADKESESEKETEKIVAPKTQQKAPVQTKVEKAPEPPVQPKIAPSEVRQSVTAQEVDSIMNDEVAESLIETSEGTTDRTKQGIINIDTLSQYFESGDVVTLDEIKKRVKGFNKKTTYIKVLARGTLDKPLTVEAHNFSLQAVKMIVLTGGKAVKIKN